MPWIESHRPKKFVDLKGQELAIRKINDFIKNYGKGKKALVFHGPPGTGKTTLAHVTAREMKAEIFELNASDLRNKDKLEQVLKPAIEQRSLISSNKIILVDEVDGISGVDRGGLPELLRLIELSSYPIIVTANDIWKKSLAPLRTKSELVQFREIDYKTIIEILKGILMKEKLVVNENILKSIALRAKGDVRAAVNDIQSTARMKDPSILTLHERDKEIDIFTALRHVFKGKPTKETGEIFDSVNMPIDELILWVEENIPREYQGVELAKAIERLSKVDIFKGRIYKQQYWRFLVYENLLLSYGVSASKNPKRVPNTNFTAYQKPSRILKIWLNNQRTEKKKSISQKYARYTHVGTRRAMNEYPLVKQIIKSNPKIQRELKLSEDEIKYVMS